MKNLNKNIKKSIFLGGIVLFSALFFGFIQYNKATSAQKVTICHVPPGNPANCHEIRISVNALQAHLNHGDRLVCNSQADVIIAKDLLGVTDIDEARDLVIINF